MEKPLCVNTVAVASFYVYSCTNKIDTEIQRSMGMSKVSKVAQYTL